MRDEGPAFQFVRFSRGAGRRESAVWELEIGSPQNSISCRQEIAGGNCKIFSYRQEKWQKFS